MDLSNLNSGYLYFYEYEGIVAVGEFFEEIEDFEALDDFINGTLTSYFAEIWSSDGDISYTTATEEIKILKELYSAYDENGKFNMDYDKINLLLNELKPEFPEYFI